MAEQRRCVVCRRRDQKLCGGRRRLLELVLAPTLVQHWTREQKVSWIEVQAGSYLCLTHARLPAEFKPEEAMTPSNPRWKEFCHRLEGPEGCNFRRGIREKINYECGGGTDKSRAITILKKMEMAPSLILASLSYFESHGGSCDCEILFNIRDAILRPQRKRVRR